MSLLGGGEGGKGGEGAGKGDAGAGNAGGGNPPAGSNSGGGGNSGGGAGGNWRDSLPDDIKADPILARYSDIPNAARALIHAQSLVGKKGIIPPGENATEQELGEFYKQLGLPELDKYELKLPEGVKGDEARMKELKQLAHKHGILPKQAQALVEWQVAEEKKYAETMRAKFDSELKEGVDSLKKEWGQGWDKNVAAARLAVREVGGEDFAKHLEKTGFGNDPMLIRFAAKVGALLGEDKIRGEVSGGKFGKTPAEIQKEISEVMANPANPYFNPRHPGHKIAVQEMEERYKQLHQG